MSDDGWPPPDQWWEEALAGGEIDQEQYDAHLEQKAMASRVYVEADVGWCIRHDDVMLRHSHPAVCHAQLRYLWTSPAHHPAIFPDHDPGQCVPVALYRQAEDP